MKRIVIICLLIVINIACSTTNMNVKEINHSSTDELLQFAEANCFFWYFKKKGYDLKDIRAITGGIVEMGSSSPEKYEKVSDLVKNYRPALSTKQDIDIDLMKCFYLRKDAEFNKAIETIK